jgi:hypothetical protein
LHRYAATESPPFPSLPITLFPEAKKQALEQDDFEVIKTLQSNSPRYAATESANLSLIANRPDS